MTFDATPRADSSPLVDLKDCGRITVCDLNGAERFFVWAIRWAASLHDDADFAAICLQESFDRAGLGNVLPVFRAYVANVHGAPAPCVPAARLGCWRINAVEAHSLHALACLQAGRFGDAWRTLAHNCSRFEAARAMLSLGEIADAMDAVGGQMRPWDGSNLQPGER